jgi:hypothetical protein
MRSACRKQALALATGDQHVLILVDLPKETLRSEIKN